MAAPWRRQRPRLEQWTCQGPHACHRLWKYNGYSRVLRFTLCRYEWVRRIQVRARRRGVAGFETIQSRQRKG